MRRRLLLVALVASAAVIVAACGNSPGSTTSTTHKSSTSTTVQTPTTGASSTSSTSTSTTAGSTACTTVIASAGASQGAAGTITGTINLADAGSAPCTMNGYPTIALLSSSGSALPVTVVDGLTVDISPQANGAAALVNLTPTAGAAFTYQFSDVTTGNETACPSTATITVTPPGSSNASSPTPLIIAPCDNGTVHVSPVYAAG